MRDVLTLTEPLTERMTRDKAETKIVQGGKTSPARAKREVHDDLHQRQAKTGPAPAADRGDARRRLHRPKRRPNLAAPKRNVGADESRS